MFKNRKTLEKFAAHATTTALHINSDAVPFYWRVVLMRVATKDPARDRTVFTP